MSFYQGFYAVRDHGSSKHSKVFCFLLIDQLEIESDGLKQAMHKASMCELISCL